MLEGEKIARKLRGDHGFDSIPDHETRIIWIVQAGRNLLMVRHENIRVEAVRQEIDVLRHGDWQTAQSCGGDEGNSQRSKEELQWEGVVWLRLLLCLLAKVNKQQKSCCGNFGSGNLARRLRAFIVLH